MIKKKFEDFVKKCEYCDGRIFYAYLKEDGKVKSLICLKCKIHNEV